MDGDLASFLAAARDLCGADRVRGGEAIAASSQRATFPWAARARAILHAPDTAVVPELLAAATRSRVPLHPVSRGRSWGLGSRLPPRDAVVLDLGDCDRILDLDMRRGTARIEPGVTFAALQARLKREGLAFHVPSFGGPPDASVLANALERGEGAGAQGDRFGALWDLDVALATGERIATGGDRHGDAAAIHARPAGPLLEGLFSQSGFGVVLSGRIALQPTLPWAASLVAEIGPADALGPALATLCRLIDAGLVAPSAAALWNGAKRRASLPGRHGADAAAIAPDDWALSLILSAPHPELMRLALALVEGELTPVTRARSMQSDRDAAGRRLETPLTGFSDGRNVISAYAGMASPPDLPGDPDADGCGFLWLCPVVPLDGPAVATLEADVATLAADPALAPAIGFQAVSARALHAYVSLAWDRDRPGADDAAMAAHDALLARFLEHGFPPYRLALPTGAALSAARGDTPAVIARLRAALDPAGVLSPGKVPGIG
ncbi:FAD-binding oxidoreductase [Salinarimonas chemoclinalis]|uniref:FAD-binding oxidoreductase n=1 Tax=Salinarimonas chemoclinalis TaxID=3241599 RepID=UPI003557635B